MPKKETQNKNNLEIIFKIAPLEYFQILYNYKNKFKIYDKEFYERLLIEQNEREKNKILIMDNSFLPNNDLRNYICPDILKENLLKNYSSNKSIHNKLNNAINKFNRQYIISMDNYIEMINKEADNAFISKKNIKPKGLTIFHLLFLKGYGSSIFSLNEELKEKNRKKEESKIDQNKDACIKEYREKISINIINNYEILKKEISDILNTNNNFNS